MQALTIPSNVSLLTDLKAIPVAVAVTLSLNKTFSSVAMTATTTLLALGTMPLWLFIFSKAEQGIAFNVPFAEIGKKLLG